MWNFDTPQRKWKKQLFLLGGHYVSHEEEEYGGVEQSEFYGDVNYNFLSDEGFSELGEHHPGSGQSSDNVFTPDTPTAAHRDKVSCKLKD